MEVATERKRVGLVQLQEAERALIAKEVEGGQETQENDHAHPTLTLTPILGSTKAKYAGKSSCGRPTEGQSKS